MTLEEKLDKLTDSQVVQGVLLNRLDQIVAGNSEAIARNAEVIAQSAGIAQARHGDIQILQDAMQRLLERMDPFIRGLGRNGRRPKRGGR